MKRQELDGLIRQNKAPNAVMLYGESHFLIDRYIRLLSNIENSNTLTLYHDEYDFTAAKAHLSQGSLFGDRNILIIKSEKKVLKNDLSALLELVKKNPDNIFIYGYLGTDFKKSATAAFNAKSGGVGIRLFTPFDSEAKNILLEEAKTMGIDMQHYSASYLLETQNNDLMLAFNELGKLQILQRPITTKEIDELVFGMGEVKTDQLINTLLDKKDFRMQLQRILESGQDEIRIITALSSHIAQLYLFYISIKISGAVDSLRVLGYKLPLRIEKERARQSIRLKQEQYMEMLTLLVEMELKMKSPGAMDKNALLLSALIRLQGIL